MYGEYYCESLLSVLFALKLLSLTYTGIHLSKFSVLDNIGSNDSEDKSLKFVRAIHGLHDSHRLDWIDMNEDAIVLMLMNM